jgi:ketosteroid isomerase-like protein
MKGTQTMMQTFRAVSRTLVAAIAAGVLVMGVQAARAEGANETERNRALVAQGFRAWADGSGSPYELLADQVRWTITGNSLAGRTYPGREAFLSEVIRPFNARMRDPLVPEVHRLYAEGDTVIAHFDARGVARDGGAYVNSYVWILRLEQGRIIEAQAFFDSIAFDDLWRRVTPAN